MQRPRQNSHSWLGRQGGGGLLQGSKYQSTASALYLAPEVIRREDRGCMAADIWSLGCCVLEMLTCRRARPFPSVFASESATLSESITVSCAPRCPPPGGLPPVPCHSAEHPSSLSGRRDTARPSRARAEAAAP
jgi:serine/threonine protein kinase